MWMNTHMRRRMRCWPSMNGNAKKKLYGENGGGKMPAKSCVFPPSSCHSIHCLSWLPDNGIWGVGMGMEITQWGMNGLIGKGREGSEQVHTHARKTGANGCGGWRNEEAAQRQWECEGLIKVSPPGWVVFFWRTTTTMWLLLFVIFMGRGMWAWACNDR